MPVTFTTAINKSVTVTSYSTLSASSIAALIDLDASVSSHGKLSSSAVTSLLDLDAPVSSHANSGSSAVTALIDLGATPSSHSTALGSSVTALVDISANVDSHATAGGSSVVSTLDLLAAPPASYSNPGTSSSSVGPIDFDRIADPSYLKESRSFAYNEFTSMELVDHQIYWNDDEKFWYTEWFQETRILGREDTLTLRSLAVPEAKQPTAIIEVQYDETGNGTVDERSDLIYVGRDADVTEITGVPVDDDGFYRLKIMEYSGYNSIYKIDTAIVN